ncbi:unnamed protein product [Boreogadus saida]
MCTSPILLSVVSVARFGPISRPSWQPRPYSATAWVTYMAFKGTVGDVVHLTYWTINSKQIHGKLRVVYDTVGPQPATIPV